MKCPTKAELRTQGTITVKFGGVQGGNFEYRLVKAYEAKNYDGSPSGFIPGTPDGERECIERKRTFDDERKSTYSKYLVRHNLRNQQ